MQSAAAGACRPRGRQPGRQAPRALRGGRSILACGDTQLFPNPPYSRWVIRVGGPKCWLPLSRESRKRAPPTGALGRRWLRAPRQSRTEGGRWPSTWAKLRCQLLQFRMRLSKPSGREFDPVAPFLVLGGEPFVRAALRNERRGIISRRRRWTWARRKRDTGSTQNLWLAEPRPPPESWRSRCLSP